MKQAVAPLLEVRGLKKYYPKGGGKLSRPHSSVMTANPTCR